MVADEVRNEEGAESAPATESAGNGGESDGNKEAAGGAEDATE